MVLKPIDRQEVKIRPAAAAGMVGFALAVIVVAWVAGRADLFKDNYLTRGIALLLLSPVLTVTAYTFLRDDELEPYRGRRYGLASEA